jgi:Rod binding domain-containing protein
VSEMHGAGRSAVMARSTSVAGERSRLMSACREVEGLFLSRLMEALDRPVFGGGTPGESRATSLFRTQRNQAIADEMGRRGELGLAQILYDDLTDHAGSSDRSISRVDSVEGAQVR